MNEVLIKILQGTEVTQTVLDGLTIYLPIANLCSVRMPKINKDSWQQTKLFCNNKQSCFFGSPYKFKDRIRIKKMPDRWIGLHQLTDIVAE